MLLNRWAKFNWTLPTYEDTASPSSYPYLTLLKVWYAPIKRVELGLDLSGTLKGYVILSLDGSIYVCWVAKSLIQACEPVFTCKSKGQKFFTNLCLLASQSAKVLSLKYIVDSPFVVLFQLVYPSKSSKRDMCTLVTLLNYGVVHLLLWKKMLRA